MKRLLDYDPLTKTTQYLHIDQVGKAVIESIQDTTDILEFNQKAAALLDRKKDMWFVGSIPIQTCQKWAKESNTRVYSKEWMVVAKRRIQEREYRKLNPNNIKL